MTKTEYVKLLMTLREIGVTEVKMTEHGLAKMSHAFANLYTTSTGMPALGEVACITGIKVFKADQTG